MSSLCVWMAQRSSTADFQTGKHGHAKVHMVAIDIFTAKKLEELCPSTHNMNVPVVNRKDLELVDISNDGFCTLMDDAGEVRALLGMPLATWFIVPCLDPRRSPPARGRARR